MKPTVESNHSADRVLPSYFAVATSTKLHSLLYNTLDVSSSKMGVELVEVSIFYKSDKKCGQTICPKKIKKSSAFVPYYGRLVLFFLQAFSVLWTYPLQK